MGREARIRKEKKARLKKNNEELVEYLVDQWNTVPVFVESFAPSAARELAVGALNLLFQKYIERPHLSCTIECRYKERFVFWLSYDLRTKEIKTVLGDSLFSKTYGFTSRFKLLID